MKNPLKYENLIIEKKEYLLLKRFVNLSRYDKNKTLSYFFNELNRELDIAHIYDEKAMPKDIVRLNSFVILNSNNKGIRKFELVMPTANNNEHDKISILEAMGVAVIGRSEGDVIHMDLPFEKDLLTITKVVQNKKPITLSMVL
jgi:regulator of nucleoside diphosphate kinase